MGDRSPAGVRVRSDLGLPERYEPLRHIATGGMASVWCARDRALGRNVAIKLLAEAFAHDEDASERFMREARAAARLSGHPNVVMTYDVGETEPHNGDLPRAFIVMEYLAGGTVADALRVDSARRVNAVKWVHEAASALDYAHGRGVLHRDIKPANLLLNRDRVLHVGDFGIARLGTEDTITAAGQVMGTASYLAPERALGRPATDASDRYSLAVAAYELLVGERPFTAPHFAAQARQHVEDAPPSASSRNRTLPRAVDAVLARGMAKRPEQRWETAQEFARALESALAESTTKPVRSAAPAPAGAARASRAGRRPLAAAPTTTAIFAAPGERASAPGSGRGPRRHRARVSALAALLAAAVVAAVAVASIGGGSPQRRADASAPPPQSVKSTRPRPAASAQPTHTAVSRPAVTAAAAATTRPPVADTLEGHGHQLMLGGNYSAAIPVLRQAVTAAPRGSLTYAYALYDLGRSLRLAGDPQDAVKVLYERLQIPNQTEAVRQELQLALVALGQQAGQSPGAPGPAAPTGQGPGGGPAAPPGAARDHGRHGHHPHGGGAGPANSVTLQGVVLPGLPSGQSPVQGD